eukprot:1014879-Pleurochrysis_carterae.AAC.1
MRNASVSRARINQVIRVCWVFVGAVSSARLAERRRMHADDGVGVGDHRRIPQPVEDGAAERVRTRAEREGVGGRERPQLPRVGAPEAFGAVAVRVCYIAESFDCAKSH